MRVPATTALIVSSAAALAINAIGASAAIAGPSVRVQVAAATNTAIPGQYIVTLKQPTAQASRLRSVRMIHQFDDGFAARLTASQLEQLQSDPDVAAIEQDQVVHIDTTQKNATWGIDRIDQRKLPLSHTYSYKHTGAGVDAYIIDTGVDPTLTEFGGRADTVYGTNDCNGHGTHVAGIIGSKTYGVAKKVRLHGVQVLNCQGQGSASDVIAGINWVIAHHGARSVANMSLGGNKSAALNAAVTKLSKAGVFLSVAAGNNNGDACATSPASAAGVETVAASASNDNRAPFSNFGKCVDLYAPGVDIKSTYLGGTAVLSGTSMATPFVTGVAALYKSAVGQKSFGTVEKWIKDHTTVNVIKHNKAGTPNRLLYKSTL